MTTKFKIIAIVLAVLVLFGAGYGAATWRHKAWLAGYSEREQKRMEQIAVNEAEQAKLRTENETIRKEDTALRADIAKLSADDEALKAIIAQHGGTIAAEAKNLEKASDQLKKDEAVAGAPSDKCTRCRRYSDSLLSAGLIRKALPCTDECAGAH